MNEEQLEFLLTLYSLEDILELCDIEELYVLRLLNEERMLDDLDLNNID